MANKMLIDATHPEETRVVVLRGNRVEEFDFESAQRKQLRGNIYLAKVTRVEPSLQAAFVDYGGNRHGFLAFSEIHPDYYQIPVADRQALIEEEERAQRAADDELERRPRRHRHRHRDRAARRDDEVIRGEAHDAPSGDAGHAEGTDYSPPAEDAPATETASAPAEFMTSEPGQGSGQESGQESDQEAGHASAAGTDLQSGATAQDRSAGNTGSEEASSEQELEAESGPSASSAEPHPADDLTPLHAAQPAEHAESPSIAEDAPDVASDAEADHHSESVAEAAPGETAEADHDFPQHSDDDHGAEHGDDENAEEAVESVGGADAMEEVPDRAPRYRRQYKIQEVIKRRQVMLVQVVKEERGTKGAALTTYLSLAGRYSVLMPNTARGGGISRKITSAEDRSRLKEVAQDLEVPEGMGVILRTAGASRTKIEIKRDFEYLLRLWETVRDLTLKSTAPKLVYEEGSLVKRSIRDLYSKDIDEVVVAGTEAYDEAKDFMRMLMPSHAKNVKAYGDTQPLLSRYGVESQLDAMFSPVVQLRSGGYIVINQAEALVAIDVNSGRATREHHIEDTALKTNLEAAEEVSRQLRLRDLAGLIVIDFIDMDENRNNRSVERRLKECLKHDRARIQVGRISHFGLLEMSRQRIRTSVLESSTEKCPYCGGSGHVRSVSSLALQVLRALEEQLMKGATHNLVARTRPDVALYVLNQKRAHLRALEQRFAITITVVSDASVAAPQSFMIERGEQVHTAEAARALAEQNQALVVTPVEEEDDFDEAGAADSEAETETEAPGSAAEHAEGGTRRRRRRRRRGGRDGHDAANGGDQPHDETAPQHHDVSATESEAFGDSGDDESGSAGGDDSGAEAGTEEAAEHGGQSDQRGDRRRRRRGRRGGRRSRNDRSGDAGSELNDDAAPAPDHQFAADNESPSPDAEPVTTSAPERASPAAWPAAPEPTAPSQPATASAPPQFDAPAVVPPAEPEPPRRRSTVRERAPIASSEEPTPQAAPAEPSSAAPEPQPSVTENGDAEDTGRPRRTGWWSRRFGRG